MFALVIIILGVLVGVIALIVALSTTNDEAKGVAKIIIAGIAFLLAVIALIGGSMATIPNGHVGVMVRFGKPTGQVLQSGLSTKPIVDTPVKMSIQTQLFADNASAASKDLQDVTATIAINYRLDPVQAVTVYRTIGIDYIRVIAHPLIQETVKEVTSRYNAEDMILRRAEVKADLADEITAKLAIRGIIAEEINITNFSFSDAFDNAIEAKVVAVQRVLEAENKLRQIEVEARQAEQQAKGQAAAIIALADGQAKANAILSKSLTPEIIQYMFIQSIKENDKVVTVPGGVTLTLPTP